MINKEIYDLNLSGINKENLKGNLKFISEGQSVINKINEDKSSKKESKWISETVVPIMNEKQNHIGFLSVTTDITDLRILEKNYNELLKKLKGNS